MHMSDADDARFGKEYITNASPQPAATNGHPTDDSATSTNRLEQKDDHAGAHTDGVTPPEHDSTPGHEKMTDSTHKEVLDDHGEEVVEAAEDTVIY